MILTIHFDCAVNCLWMAIKNLKKKSPLFVIIQKEQLKTLTFLTKCGGNYNETNKSQNQIEFHIKMRILLFLIMTKQRLCLQQMLIVLIKLLSVSLLFKSHPLHVFTYKLAITMRTQQLLYCFSPTHAHLEFLVKMVFQIFQISMNGAQPI